MKSSRCGDYVSERVVPRVITKLLAHQPVSSNLQVYARFQLGYVLRGEKHFVSNEQRLVCREGEIFFIPMGCHHTENISAANERPFEQIAFDFSASEISSMLSAMIVKHDLALANRCDEHTRMNVLVIEPSSITRGVFEALNLRYDLGGFISSPLSEHINLANVLISIMEHDSELLKRAIARTLNREQLHFERVVYDNILIDKKLDELASEAHRSLTTFKKEFKRLFGAPPHSWYLNQRMRYAKSLLAMTDDTIAAIGEVCTFNNTSHFIKLYKSHYGVTPAQHRRSMLLQR